MIDESIFPCFYSDLWMIVLVQVSSCAAKQIFSQMKFILDVFVNVYEYHLGVVIFSQCNGNLNPLWIQTINNY